MKNKTKKYNFAILMFFIFLLLSSIIKAGDKGFFTDLSANSFSNSDSEFKETYKPSIIVPEIGIGYFLSDKFYVFGGFELFSVKGQTPEWDFVLNMNQKIFSIGAGYFKGLSDKLGLCGEIGLVSISYVEKLIDLELENKSSCIGFRLSTKLQYRISDLIGLYLKLGYTIAKDTIDDIESNFGGIKTGLGLRLFF